MKRSVPRFLGLAEERLSPIACGGLFTLDGYGLLYRPNTPSDFATLPQSARLLHQYLKLEPGQIVMSSDPTCGSALPSDLTLVAGVGSKNTTELLLTSRIRFRPQLYLSEDFPQEILKIPPTPIAGFPNIETHELLKAIDSQFQVPEDFVPRVKAEIEKMRRLSASLGQLFRTYMGGSKARLWLEPIREFQKKAIFKWFEDIPLANAFHQRELDGGGKLGLEIHAGHEKIRLDFSKSELPRNYNLTNAMTAGVGAAGMWSFFNGPEWICGALLEFIDVVTPTNSRLNSHFPTSSSLGELLLTPLMLNCVTETCNRLMPNRAQAQMGSSVILDVRFDDGRQWFDRVLGGGGATADGPGIDGQASWLHLPLFPSVEEVEKKLPLLIVRQERRGGSGGRGARAGGEGIRKTVEFLESATLTWAMENSRLRPEGWSGGSSGDSASMTLLTVGEEARLLEANGSVRVTKGTKLTLLAPGGGGHFREAT